MKLPAFQFYPGDWRKDTGVQSLDFESRGVWFELLCLMHESESRGVLTLNGKAMPEDALGRLLGLDSVLLKQILTKLEAHGVASRQPNSGALMSRRMVRDEELRKIRQNAGKRGGNPLLLNQKPTTGVNQKPTPSSSSSSSDNTKRAASPMPLPFESDAFRTAWDLFTTHRQEIKKPLKPTSAAMSLKMLSALGEQRAIRAIEHTIAKGWQGLREPDAQTPSMGQQSASKPAIREPLDWRSYLNHNFPGSRFSAGQPDEAHQWSDLDHQTQVWLIGQMRRSA